MINREILRSIEFFEDLDEDVLQALLDRSESMELVRGDVIFEEGAAADTLYVVEQGRIAISNKSFDGRESMVALMEEGDLFGEMALFDGLGRSAEARALEASQVLAMPFEPLLALWNAQPNLLWKVVGLLSATGAAPSSVRWFLVAQGFVAGMLSGACFALYENLTALSAAGSGNGTTILLARVGTGLLHIVTAGMVGWGSICQPSTPLADRAAHRWEWPRLSSTRHSSRVVPSGSSVAAGLKTV